MSANISSQIIRPSPFSIPNNRGNTISIILLADAPAELRAPFRSVVKLMLENVIIKSKIHLDVIVATRKDDDELIQYFVQWNDALNHVFSVSTIIKDVKKGHLLADAVKRSWGDILVFLTPGFIIDRQAFVRGQINQSWLMMRNGISLIRGYYGVSNAVNEQFGSAGTVSSPPYVLPPDERTSVGGLKEYSYYFPFRHLSTIRVRKSFLLPHLDFLSNFDEALDVAVGALAIYEAVRIKTTSLPFVNMLTAPAVNIEKVKEEVSVMKKYFSDMNDYTGRMYFDYLQGVMNDVERGNY
ncbi:MAG: hypothetical protein QW292_02855 [Candidatus Parvarchaeota archaeon]